MKWKGRRVVAVSVLLVLAGLMGAAGNVLAAAGAHAMPGAGLDIAAYLLLFHAVAVVGGAALALAALGGWVAGATLFSGDVALRAFAGHRLFPFAAPSGGMILIAAWLVLAAAAVAGALTRS
jgi:uncharacterized membrane protein YgdD (TMEM256/DUF423 family)